MGNSYLEVVDRAAIERRVSELGQAIAADHEGLNPVLVGVLKGCVPFLADLTRQIDIPHEVDFLLLTRFGERGRVSVAMDTAISLEGRHVILVEDIVDTGLTLSALLRSLSVRAVAGVKTVALLDKVPRRIVDVPVDYRGFEIGDEFLLGYGLDWGGRYRNLPSLWAVMDMEQLTDLDATFPTAAFGNGAG
ncbi:MAG: hypoxanthine phosphoribosyltransferase [Acidimicrobiia bacterium]|nr:hypoxanthine phosphoribosyltransferase [Acidimicrobiia bacterium]